MSLEHVGVTLTRWSAGALDFSLRGAPSTRDYSFVCDHHQNRRFSDMLGDSVHHAGFGIEGEVSLDSRCRSEIAYIPY